jgi:hypothetical protein
MQINRAPRDHDGQQLLNYDMLLRVWLSTGDAAAPAAITMLAEHL